VLSEFARAMATDFPIQGILDHLVAQIVDILPITGAGVTLISPSSEPRYVAASSPAAMRFEQLQTELAEGPCLAAYHTGESVSVPDLRNDHRFGTFCPNALEAGLAAVFAFPLRHGQSRLGALDLYRNAAGPLSPDAMSAAQTLADVAAAYLLNARARADLQDSADRSREASLHDPLTGLPNRALMLERLEHASQRGRRSHKAMTLFFLDLDGFKTINDTYGHQVGDELLVAVADRLSAAMRPDDTVARMSGDEFLVLCEGLYEPLHTETVMARLVGALAQPFSVPSKELTITASIGFAVCASGDHSPERLIRDADLAMYKSKRRALGTRSIADGDAQEVRDDSESLASALPGAIERNELRLDYQPIVDARSGRISAVEALLRWDHCTRGVVPPALVIPIAEQSGQILDIGQWVLKQAWADRQTWDGKHSHNVGVSVNVSAHQLMAAGFADSVASVLLSGATDPRLMTLEVTDAVFLRDSDRAVIVLNALKGMGVNLALDDFGTGYCSLGQILDYPMDEIKIDRPFIANLAPDTASSTILAAVIDLAHRLGMTVVSEGIETIGQHKTLTGLGSDACQGFYFARPMSAADINSLIQTGSPGARTRLPVFADPPRSQ
jgi:diguanylate cyclase (GGDEF)-like protein